MSVFDDPRVQLEVGGIEVDPQDLAEEIRLEEVNSDRVSWPVVERWCLDHPCQVRLIVGKYAQVSTMIRRRYPRLTVRTIRHRPRPDGSAASSKICDVLVTYVPPGEVNPFGEGVPGLPYRYAKRSARWDAPRS